MLVEISHDEFLALENRFYATPWHEDDYAVGRIIDRYRDAAAGTQVPTLTLPGPDGYPNEQVPQDGWLD